MKNKILGFMTLAISSFGLIAGVNAATTTCDGNEVAKIGDNCYATLSDAVADASSSEKTTIEVVKDIPLTGAVNIDGTKKIELNLTNNAVISYNDYSFYVSDTAELSITGKGIIANTFGHYQASSTATNTIYLGGNAKLEIGKDVTVTGFDVITFFNSTNATLDLYGTLVSAKDDVNLTDGLPTLGSGVSVGSDNTNATVNIHDGAVIKGEGVGLYLAGANVTTIDKATITGATGIAIKSGTITLNGATVTGTYEYADPSSWDGGVKTTGAAIQVETNDDYVGNVKIVVNDGSYTSEHSYAFQEYAAEDESETAIDSLEINAGTFKSNPDEGNNGISVSEQFADAFADTSFIASGTVFLSNNEPAEDVLDYTNGLDISQSGVVGKIYKIEAKAENGSVTVNADAAAGETVKINYVANDGYKFSKITVTYEKDGKTTEVKVADDGTFVMPDGDVKVNVTFVKIAVPEDNKPDEAPATFDNVLGYVVLAFGALGTAIISKKVLSK